MKLLLDEDSQSKLLVQLLRDVGHEVETGREAGIPGKSDIDLFAYAKRSDRILLTRNGRDFLLLYQADQEHPGILFEYQDADPTRNISYAQIAEAITKIEASRMEIRRQFLSISMALGRVKRLPIAPILLEKFADRNACRTDAFTLLV